LIRSWKIADARARRRRILIRGFVGALLGGLAVFAGRATVQDRESQRRERSAGWALISQQTGTSDSSRLLDSLIYATAATAETASADASTASRDLST
jgi:hypothetical protein